LLVRRGLLDKNQKFIKTLVHGLIFCSVYVLIYPTLIQARGKYLEGDWVSYSVFRYVTSVALDYRHVYFGTTGGVTRYDRWDKYWEPPLTTTDGLPDNWVRNIAYDPDRGEIWADTYLGPAVYNSAFGEWTREDIFPRELVQSDTSIFRLPDLFTDYGPTSAGSFYVMDENLNRYAITNYLRGDNNEVWVTTWGLNAGMASLNELRLKMFSYGLYDKDVKAVLIDGNDIWFGGTGFLNPSSGITRYNRKTQSWKYYYTPNVSFLASNAVNALAADSQYVWLGTAKGLSRMKKKDSTWWTYTSFDGLPDEQITTLKSEGRYLWIGTPRGLAVFDVGYDTLVTIHDPLMTNLYIFSILTDSHYVWVGTDAGVYTLDKEKKTWYRFMTSDGLLSNQVRSIARWSGQNMSSGKEEIWFGTDVGILGYSPVSDKSQVYDNRLNFPEVDVFKLVCDKTNLWAATKNGVWKLNQTTGIWIKYTTDDGLLDNDVQDMVLDGDYIWFGTPLGATRFYWNDPNLRE
jgi:ligand-binding sensor domain-containing protein